MCSQADVSDDTAYPRRSGAKALPLKVGMIPLHMPEELSHAAALPTASSYLTSNRSAFGKGGLQTRKRACIMNIAATATCATTQEGVLQQGASTPSLLPANTFVM